MSHSNLDQLLGAVVDADQVLILPHNDPDPDAIASAFGLKKLLMQRRTNSSVQIAFQGIIGRAENKALVRYLGRPLRPLTTATLQHATCIALVDTQPGTGNNPLPADVTPHIVLDHHVWRDETTAAAFYDVRPGFGSTSTIVAEYLYAAGIVPNQMLATALFYGIKTDTMGLVRGATPADVEMFHTLQALTDLNALDEIQRAQVPASYFKGLVTAFQAARIRGPLLTTYLGAMSYPDQAAEIADTLLRLQGTTWVICVGYYEDELIISVRSRARSGGAGQLVRAVVGDLGMAGGHGTMAAGHVPLNGVDPARLAETLEQRALKLLDLDSHAVGAPLI
ncbi:MAG: DHH family phosphoesterase [Anaerolineae bacterium]|nr:DHH family phosphoesterase [Anaerolineae bacterium]MCB0252709.1 DHH family phosphoesterase [Anaerolineae bacterium]